MGYRNSWVISSIFMISDTAILYGIFHLAVILRNMLTPLLGHSVLWQDVAPLAELGILFGIVVFMIEGLYPGYGFTAIKELERMSKSVTLAFFLLAGVSYLNKPFQDFPRSVLLIAWGLALGILPIAHFVLRNLLSRTRWYGIPVIIFGEGEWAKQIEKSLHRVRRLGWRVQAVFPVQVIERLPKKPLGQIAILASSFQNRTGNYARILSLRFQKVVLMHQQDNFGSLWVEPRDLDGQLGLEFHYHLWDRPSVWIKRAIDLVGASLLLFLLIPLLGLLVLLIMIDSPGPIFFRQERTGQNFKHFKVLKFRTMVVNAEQKLQQLLKESPEIRSEFEKYHKLEKDPRVTRVGNFLRRFYLDELPQLWNVLKGDMSLVGPRPVLDYEISKMETYAPIILRVKPGMTGWWQVTGRHQIDFLQRVRLEEYYISNWSLWMDIYILMKTVWVVLGGKGA